MTQKSIRDIVTEMLSQRGHTEALASNDAIFTSGLMDSLAATELMILLESDFGIDLANADFDISQLDTIGELESLVATA